MNEFKLKISSTLGIIIFVIVGLLVTTSFISYKNESVALNTSILKEKNATVVASLTEKFASYHNVLSGVKVSSSDISKAGLSQSSVSQLEMLFRTQTTFIEGAYLIDIEGGIYNVKGKKLEFNVKELGRDYYKAMFNQNQQFLFHLLSPPP